jgi:hypothetical protein
MTPSPANLMDRSPVPPLPVGIPAPAAPVSPPVMSSPEIVDHLDAAHQRILDATDQAHAQEFAGLPAPAQQAASLAGIAPKPAVAAPTQGLAAPSVPVAPITPVHQELNRLETSPSGIGKLPMAARIPLSILDAIGRSVAPGIEEGIPGTQGHHDYLVRGAQKAVAGEDTSNEAASKIAQQNAEAQHAQAGAGLEIQQAETLKEEGKRAPKADLVTVGDGLYDAAKREWVREPSDKDKDKLTEIDPEFGKAIHVAPTADGRYLVPSSSVGELLKPQQPKEPKEGEMSLGERVPQINQAMTARYQVLHPGQPLPAHYQLPSDATQKDFDRTDKLMEGEEKAFGTKDNQAQTMELRKQTQQMAEQNRQDRQAREATGDTDKERGKVREGLLKDLSPLNSQLENIEEAKQLVNGGSVAQALGKVKTLVGVAGGRGSGVRITQAELNAELSHRGIKRDMEGWLNSLSGKGNMSAEDVKQFNDVLGAIESTATKKQGLYNDTLDKLNGAKSVDDVRRIEQDYRHASAGGGVSGKTFTQADVDAAVAAHGGTASDIEKAFKSKGWVKK